MEEVVYEGIKFKKPSHVKMQKTYEVLVVAGIIHTSKVKGILIAQPCEICGITENIHAHHEDYSRPLEVRWLCAYHHSRVHSLFKKKKV